MPSHSGQQLPQVIWVWQPLGTVLRCPRVVATLDCLAALANVTVGPEVLSERESRRSLTGPGLPNRCLQDGETPRRIRLFRGESRCSSMVRRDASKVVLHQAAVLGGDYRRVRPNYPGGHRQPEFQVGIPASLADAGAAPVHGH